MIVVTGIQLENYENLILGIGLLIQLRRLDKSHTLWSGAVASEGVSGAVADDLAARRRSRTAVEVLALASLSFSTFWRHSGPTGKDVA